jgi:uncharacterized protein YqjF (DUF2071 family)
MNASTNHPARESAARIVAVDLAKDLFELAFADAAGRTEADRSGSGFAYAPHCRDRKQKRQQAETRTNATIINPSTPSPLDGGVHTRGVGPQTHRRTMAM